MCTAESNNKDPYCSKVIQQCDTSSSYEVILCAKMSQVGYNPVLFLNALQNVYDLVENNVVDTCLVEEKGMLYKE